MKLELEGDDHVAICLLIVAGFLCLIVWCVYSYNVKLIPSLSHNTTNAPVLLEDKEVRK